MSDPDGESYLYQLYRKHKLGVVQPLTTTSYALIKPNGDVTFTKPLHSKSHNNIWHQMDFAFKRTPVPWLEQQHLDIQHLAGTKKLWYIIT